MNRSNGQRSSLDGQQQQQQQPQQQPPGTVYRHRIGSLGMSTVATPRPQLSNPSSSSLSAATTVRRPDRQPLLSQSGLSSVTRSGSGSGGGGGGIHAMQQSRTQLFGSATTSRPLPPALGSRLASISSSRESLTSPDANIGGRLPAKRRLVDTLLSAKDSGGSGSSVHGSEADDARADHPNLLSPTTSVAYSAVGSAMSIISNGSNNSGSPRGVIPQRDHLRKVQELEDARVVLETKLSESRRQLQDAEFKCQGLQRDIDLNKLSQERAERKLRSDVDELTRRNTQLEADRALFCEREKTASENAESLLQDMNNMRTGYEAQIRELQRKLEDANYENQVLRISSSSNGNNQSSSSNNSEYPESQKLIQQLSQWNEDYQSQVETLSQRLTQSEEHAERLLEEVAERDVEVSSLRDELAHAQNKLILISGTSSTVEQNLIKLQHAEQRVSELVNENEILVNKVSNVRVLEERIVTLESQVAMQQEVRERLAAMEALMDDVDSERASWTSSLQQLCERDQFVSRILVSARQYTNGSSLERRRSRHSLGGSGGSGASAGLSDVIQSATPQLLVDALGIVQLEVATDREKQGDLSCRLIESERRCTDLQARLDKEATALATATSGYNKVRAIAVRHKQTAQLMQQQIDLYSAQIHSFLDEHELTSSFNKSNSGSSGGSATPVDQLRTRLDELHGMLKESQAQRMRDLEMVQARDKEIEQLRVNVSSSSQQQQQQQQQQGSASTESKERLDELMAENERLNAMLEKQDLELAAMERAIGSGQYNPATTRILALIDNPTSVAWRDRDNALDGLREANRVLQEQLANISSSASASTTISTAATASVTTAADNGSDVEMDFEDGGSGGSSSNPTVLKLCSENTRLLGEVTMLTKRMQRLKDAQLERTNEMRMAVYQILGFEMKFLSNDRLSFRSRYAQQNDHSFVFQTNHVGNKGTMQLCGGGNTEHISAMKPMIRLWIQERNSIPAFMAQVTMELFEATSSISRGIASHQRHSHPRNEMDED
ncbi:hypothetical protein GQ42DRAFT_163308 [Ramicandelaber brevisporus]|nr:hypothetical protein GQ42DRAFT_163308 [Ramicandelaber brevisporus]